MIVFNYSVVLEIGRHMEAGLGVKGVTDIGKGQEFVVLYYLLCIARNEVKLMINKPKNHIKYVNIYIYVSVLVIIFQHVTNQPTITDNFDYLTPK